MEAKRIYTDLINAFNYDKKEVLNPDSFHLIELLKIVEYLETETRKEAAKTAGDSKPLKYASIVLKNKSNKCRPILQKAIIRDGLQVFTDSFIAFKLQNHIEGLEMHDQKDFENYPKLDKLFLPAQFTITKKFDDLIDELALLKDDDIYILKNDYGYKIGMYVKNIKIMYNVMRFKKGDIISFGIIESQSTSYTRPLFIDNNGDSCILLPIRMEE
jgi:hypothetical protein